MSSDENNLFVGLELDSGDEVRVPIFHTLIAGQTQLSGKSEVLKKFAKLMVEKGYKVLLFDTKENFEDYANFGHEIPVCLRESTDALVLLPLLESVFQRRLPTGYYSVLCDLSSGTKTFAEVIHRAKDMEKSSRSGWKQGACRTLYDLLERLEGQLSKVDTVSTLELPYEINRMVLNQFPQASQQLFLKSAFEDVLHVHNHMTVSQLDESFKYLPQHYSSACARAIQDAITQLAITKSYVHLATQYLAPTNKDPLKACAVRLLGTQDHKTEAVHTLDLIPFRGLATVDDIMTLPLGHFYVVTKKWAKKTYFLPNGVSKEVGREVALGKKSSEYVRDFVLKRSRVLGDDDLLYKEKAEKLERDLEEEKKKRKELEQNFANKRTEIFNEASASLKEDLEANYVPKAEHERIVDGQTATIQSLTEKAKLGDALGSYVSQIVDEKLAKLPRGTQGQGEETVTIGHERVKYVVEDVGDRTVKIQTTTVDGQILYCAIELSKKQEEFSWSDLQKEMAENGWKFVTGTINNRVNALIRDSKLIKVSKGSYRLPSKVPFDMVKRE